MAYLTQLGIFRVHEMSDSDSQRIIPVRATMATGALQLSCPWNSRGKS